MGWAQLGRTAANFLTLVACMTDADASPFDQQVATHRDYLLRFARLQLRNDTWAEDAVSETLLAALGGVGLLDDGLRLTTQNPSSSFSAHLPVSASPRQNGLFKQFLNNLNRYKEMYER